MLLTAEQDVPVPHGKHELGFGINQRCCLCKTRDFWLLKFHWENTFPPPGSCCKEEQSPSSSMDAPLPLSRVWILPFHPFPGMDPSPWQLPEAGAAFSLYFSASLAPICSHSPASNLFLLAFPCFSPSTFPFNCSRVVGLSVFPALKCGKRFGNGRGVSE